MSVMSPDDLALEKACIQRTQAAVEKMQQNLAGLEMLARMEARLTAEIADVVASLEMIAKLRAELWTEQHAAFERGKALAGVEKLI